MPARNATGIRARDASATTSMTRPDGASNGSTRLPATSATSATSVKRYTGPITRRSGGDACLYRRTSFTKKSAATVAADRANTTAAPFASPERSATRKALSGQSSHVGIGVGSTRVIARGPSVTTARTAQTSHRSPERSRPVGYDRIRWANATNASPLRM
jgi:hypothetical protein